MTKVLIARKIYRMRLAKDETEKNVMIKPYFHLTTIVVWSVYETNFGSLSIVEKFPDFLLLIYVGKVNMEFFNPKKKEYI